MVVQAENGPFGNPRVTGRSEYDDDERDLGRRHKLDIEQLAVNKCRNCNGHGFVSDADIGDIYWNETVCSRCNGTGYQPTEAKLAMRKPVILFRASLAEQGELEEARRFFHVVESRADVLDMAGVEKTLVIPRYSALPYFAELVHDLERLGATPINSYAQHRYVADIREWYLDFEDVTPQTWIRVEDVPVEESGPFVLKGMTNSRKQKWKTHMFAETRADITRVMCNLLDDPLISEQGICVRHYEPFETFPIKSINGLPVTNEWRFFILDGEVLCGAFYWSEHLEELTELLKHDASLASYMDDCYSTAYYFVQNVVAPRLRDKIRFVVADVALNTADDEWRLVELNDGQMSGLAGVPAGALYGLLARRFEEKSDV